MFKIPNKSELSALNSGFVSRFHAYIEKMCRRSREAVFQGQIVGQTIMMRTSSCKGEECRDTYMSDKNLEQSTVNTGGLCRPTRVSRWRRWHHKTQILLILLGTIGLTIYLLLVGLAKQYAGIGAALCAVAVGGFLIWHLVHLFAEEDVLEQRYIDHRTDSLSSPQPTPVDKTTNPNKPAR